MDFLVEERGTIRADGVLMGIGISSHQLDTAERGLFCRRGTPLDMRMSQQETSATNLVNTLT